MKIIIADSGSTKTNWQVVDGNFQPLQKLETQGLNPYYQNLDQIYEIVKNGLPALDADRVYYYGAGCSVDPMKEILKKALESALNCSDVQVEHDLLGTCRSLIGQGKGIAAILGTGSNSCVTDEGEITEHLPSLGFLLGDEGSGGHMGKLLVTYYLNHEMPSALRASFEADTGSNRETILENVYRKPLPNRYLAGFAKYIGLRKDEDFFRNLILESFRGFFEKRVSRYTGYQTLPVGVSGSIAHYFEKELRQVAKEFDLKGELVIEQDPLPGLVKYHAALSAQASGHTL